MAIECAPLTIYSAKNVILTFDGRRVIGLWEGDDAITIERSTDLGTPLVGADGASVVSLTADQSVTLTVKLMANSAMNQYLANVARLLRLGSTRLMVVGLLDTTTGEGGGCSNAVIQREPNIVYGANASEREWQIFCNCWQPTDVIYNPAG